jgi:hypothetical protein
MRTLAMLALISAVATSAAAGGAAADDGPTSAHGSSVSVRSVPHVARHRARSARPTVIAEPIVIVTSAPIPKVSFVTPPPRIKYVWPSIEASVGHAAHLDATAHSSMREVHP